MALYTKCCLALVLMLVICEISYGKFGKPRKPSHRARRAVLFDRLQRSDDIDAVLPDFVKDEFESYEDKRGNDEDGAHVEHHQGEHGIHGEDSGEPEFTEDEDSAHVEHHQGEDSGEPEFTEGPGEFTEGPPELGRLFGKRDVDQLTNAEATRKLMQDIFYSGYASEVSPLKNGEKVSIGLMYLCARYDKTERVLTSRVWQRMSWTDSRLQWDPKDYNGITEIRVKMWHIWTPDITLYNAVESPERDWHINALVYSTGSVWYIPPSTYKTVCRPNPHATRGGSYDCSLKMGSWTYDASLMPLELDHPGLNTDEYLADCPYTISKTNSKIESTVYEGLEHPYHTFSANFTISPNNYDFKFRN